MDKKLQEKLEKIFNLANDGRGNGNEENTAKIKLKEMCEKNKINFEDFVKSMGGWKSEKKEIKLFMMMGSYVKSRVNSDNFGSMLKEEIIKDVKSRMNPKSKYFNKNVMSCVKWYRAEKLRKAA